MREDATTFDFLILRMRADLSSHLSSDQQRRSCLQHLLSQSCLVMGVFAVLCVNMLTAIMVLSVSLPDAGTECQTRSALFVTTPKKIEALRGTCLQIPCSFRKKNEGQFDSTREIFGVWIKNDKFFDKSPNNVIFNSSGTVNIYPMKITGNLQARNCTTLFSSVVTANTDEYYFRIENGPFRATAECDPLQITVKDSPQRPKVEIPGDLKEKESVTITCSAFTPCPHSPPQLTWTLQQDSHNYIQENTDGTFTTKIQEIITLSDNHDGNSITCSAKYPVDEGEDGKTAEETKTLSVSYAPQNTTVSISPSGLVSAGEQVNLTCSSRANPPVSHFIWFKISKDGALKVSEGEIYIFNLTDGGDYYCVAVNHLGNQTSVKFHLSVSGTEKFALWTSALGGIVVVVLICLAVTIWCFKSKRPTPQQLQGQRDDMLANVTEDTIHYGEINFSGRNPEVLSASVEDSGQQNDTLYSTVKVSVSPEDLYAQVQKK